LVSNTTEGRKPQRGRKKFDRTKPINKKKKEEI